MDKEGREGEGGREREGGRGREREGEGGSNKFIRI